MNKIKEIKECLANLNTGDYGAYCKAVERLQQIVREEEEAEERKSDNIAYIWGSVVMLVILIYYLLNKK